jgi:small nuclear ribonucleoprotein (snRNP)-like protein
VGNRDKLIRQSLRERFVITLKGGETFDGLLVDADEKTLRLVNVAAVGKTSRVSLDGELFIPRSDVAYLQKPGGVE